MNLGICRYAGKGQGEVSLLRQLWDVLSPGDVLLGDRLVANWVGIFMLRERGVELVLVNDPRCIEMMERFIAERPDLWDEDIGE